MIQGPFADFRSGIDLVRTPEPENCRRISKNVALRKLRLLNQARVLGDLRVPPGNRLEALRADRQGAAFDPDQ